MTPLSYRRCLPQTGPLPSTNLCRHSQSVLPSSAGAAPDHVSSDARFPGSPTRQLQSQSPRDKTRLRKTDTSATVPTLRDGNNAIYSDAGGRVPGTKAGWDRGPFPSTDRRNRGEDADRIPRRCWCCGRTTRR